MGIHARQLLLRAQLAVSDHDGYPRRALILDVRAPDDLLRHARFEVNGRRGRRDVKVVSAQRECVLAGAMRVHAQRERAIRSGSCRCCLKAERPFGPQVQSIQAAWQHGEVRLSSALLDCVAASGELDSERAVNRHCLRLNTGRRFAELNCLASLRGG